MDNETLIYLESLYACMMDLLQSNDKHISDAIRKVLHKHDLQRSSCIPYEEV
jgi:hypothetical protein